MGLNWIPNIFIFILGLCIGSFLNCVIYRLEQEKSFLKGRSFCPSCKHELSWKDLFPVVSWIFLQGKCRYCKAKISWQYPVVEISTAVIFLLIYNEFSIIQFLNLLFWFYVVSSLIIIFVYDLKHYLIPDNVLMPAILISILFYYQNWLSALVASGFFFLLWLVSRGRWMGFGDVKLAILLGLLLGFPNIIVGLFLAFFIGSIVGIFLITKGKKKLKSEVPFGPFLILGTLLALFWGQQSIGWYLNLV